VRTWLASITLALLLLFGLFAGTGWLLYTEAGAGWFLSQLGVRTEAVEGTLIGQLRLRSLQLDRLETTLTCAMIELDSRLTGLFPLRLKIDRLLLARPLFTQQASSPSSSPPQLNWPDLPWWAGWLEIELRQLRLTEGHVRQGTTDRQLKQLTARGRWRERRLQLSAFELKTPDLHLRGNVVAEFAPAALRLELQAQNKDPQQSWQQLQLQGALEATDTHLLSGPVSITVADPSGPWLSLAGKLALENNAVLFQELLLKSERRNGRLLASGRLNFSSFEAGLTSRLQLLELDLQPEVGEPLRLSGEIELNGTPDSYHGRFNLASRAEQPFAAQLAGNFAGDRQQLQLSELSGEWLHGRLSGQLQTDWREGWQINGQLSGSELDPSQIHGQLQGSLNFHLGCAASDRGQGLTGKLSLALNDSILQQQTLTGQLHLKVEPGQLEITNLELQGRGFSLQGHGALADQLQFSWQVEQLEQLLPGMRGQLQGSGHLALAPEGISADVSSHGEKLQYADLAIERWQLQGALAESGQAQLTFTGHNLEEARSELSLREAQLAVSGTISQHVVDFRVEQTGSNLQGHLSGSWNDRQWQGAIEQLRIEDSRLGPWQTHEATTLLLDQERLQLGRLRLDGHSGGSLQLQGSYLPSQQQGEGELAWQSLDLILLNPWLNKITLTGSSSGSLVLQQAPARLHGQIAWQGELSTPRQTFTLTRGNWQSDWGAQGLQSRLSLRLQDGSQLDVELVNDEEFATRWPQQLRLQLNGKNIDLQRIQPWLPPGLSLTGRLNLQSDGRWDAEQPWQLTGLAELSGARLAWQEDEGPFSTDLSKARLRWQWHNQLSGQLELQLKQRGNLEANLSLPLAARLPLQFDKQQPLQGELSAQLQELGLLSALFPGRVQESSGQLQVKLQLSGIWPQPLFQGEVRVLDCQAYLPRPGIQLDDIELQGQFEGQHFSLTSLQARSGNGALSGTGEIQLVNWLPGHYHLLLNGTNFQLLNLPELQAEISPELTIDGNLKQVSIKGTLQVPSLLASGLQQNGLAENSPDLVIVDAPVTTSKPMRIQPQIDLQLQLGDKVLLKTSGIDARLEGSLHMQSTPQQALAAFGQINVAKGRYASYGVNLDISRGNLIFNGGLISQPLLDILALRTAGEVKAGVQVSGTPKRPVVKLYSEPTMPETEILSYIVLGRPVDAQTSQSSVLMTAAGALLSQGESVVLQEKLKDKLGLDVLDINAGNGDTESSVITTGKYLRPDLYVSFGYSLFNNSNEVKLRYTLSPSWEVESNFGTESGADLFYKIDIP